MKVLPTLLATMAAYVTAFSSERPARADEPTISQQPTSAVAVRATETRKFVLATNQASFDVQSVVMTRVAANDPANSTLLLSFVTAAQNVESLSVALTSGAESNEEGVIEVKGTLSNQPFQGKLSALRFDFGEEEALVLLIEGVQGEGSSAIPLTAQIPVTTTQLAQINVSVEETVGGVAMPLACRCFQGTGSCTQEACDNSDNCTPRGPNTSWCSNASKVVLWVG